MMLSDSFGSRRARTSRRGDEVAPAPLGSKEGQDTFKPAEGLHRGAARLGPVQVQRVPPVGREGLEDEQVVGSLAHGAVRRRPSPASSGR